MSSPGNPVKSGAGYPGSRGVSSDNSLFNTIMFMIHQQLSLVRTATIVKVVACTNDGGLSPVGFVDVIPQVNLIDGFGNAQQHGTVFNLPYMRIQGGTNALIMDPAVGDLGNAIFADRDISSVKANKGQANPGSRRRFNWSDGMYIGGLLNGTPKQYIQFTSNEINIEDANENIISLTPSGIAIADANGNTISMTSSGITINGVLFDRSQNITNANDVSLAGGVDLSGHIHGGVTTGTDNTGGPTG